MCISQLFCARNNIQHILIVRQQTTKHPLKKAYKSLNNSSLGCQAPSLLLLISLLPVEALGCFQ